MLLLSPPHPKHAVEKQVLYVRGRETFKAEIRSVDQNLSQTPDLRAYVESRGLVGVGRGQRFGGGHEYRVSPVN